MIVEMKANESLIDQIENATLNISSIQKERSVSDASASLSLRKSQPLPHDVRKHQSSIDLSSDLSGHESRPSADFKYVNYSKTAEVLAVDKCWMEGDIVCKESRLMCSGFGEIDCRGSQCMTSPTLICNMDLTKAKCTGHGSCKKNPTTGEISGGTSLSFMATAIVVVTITLGILVLAGTTIYVYLS